MSFLIPARWAARLAKYRVKRQTYVMDAARHGHDSHLFLETSYRQDLAQQRDLSRHSNVRVDLGLGE